MSYTNSTKKLLDYQFEFTKNLSGIRLNQEFMLELYTRIHIADYFHYEEPKKLELIKDKRIIKRKYF